MQKLPKFVIETTKENFIRKQYKKFRNSATNVTIGGVLILKNGILEYCYQIHFNDLRICYVLSVHIFHTKNWHLPHCLLPNFVLTSARQKVSNQNTFRKKYNFKKPHNFSALNLFRRIWYQKTFLISNVRFKKYMYKES